MSTPMLDWTAVLEDLQRQVSDLTDLAETQQHALTALRREVDELRAHQRKEPVGRIGTGAPPLRGR